MKINAVHITAMPRPMPEGMFDPMPKVIVGLEDGSAVTLFEYYPDEISFTESEFLGLTVEEARRLKFEKDRAFLRDEPPT